MNETLPALDEHSVTIDASVEVVSAAVIAHVEEAFTSARMARIAAVLGCADRRPSGPRPLAAGSVLAGFRVTAVTPGEHVALAGEHRFSYYSIDFRLVPLGHQRTLLTLESRAAFRGPAGRIYRTLLLRSGGHGRAVRSMLRDISHRTTANAG